MKRGRGAFFAMALFFYSGSAARAEEEGLSPRMIVQLNENKGMWTSTADPKKEGGQALTYFNFSYMADTYGVTVLGSYADTAYGYSDPAKSDFHLSSMMDSTLSAYYMPPKLLDTTVRLGLDFNLPTGHASFTTAELGSLMIDGVSKDLMMVPSFGRGFAAAPNIAASRAFGNNLLGIGVRYEITGAYNPTKDQPDKTYDPGDSLTVFGSVQHNITQNDQLFADLSMVMTTRDKQGGIEVMKQGTAYNLGIRYVQSSETSRWTYGTSYGWQDKNQTYNSGGITTEDRNSNNNRYELMVNGMVVHSPKLMLNGTFSYKNIIANGWASTDQLYDAGYQKVTLSLGGTYAISGTMFTTFEIKGFQVWNGKDSLEPVAAIYRGLNVDIGFVYSWGGLPKKALAEAPEREVVSAKANAETVQVPAVPKVAPKVEVAPPKKPVLMAEVKKADRNMEKPGIPAGVRAVFGNAKVTLTWKPVEGAESYAVYWSNRPGAKPEEKNRIGGITGAAFEHKDLVNDTGYYYTVAAVNAGGESPLSEQTFAIPRPAAPSAPMGLSVSPGNAKVTLAWEAVPAAVDYWISRSNDRDKEGVKVGSTPKTSYTDRDLANGQTYYYSVRGINSGGEGEASFIVSATPQVPPPPAPGGFSVSLTGKGVLIKWDAVAGANKYRVFRTIRPGLRGDWIFSGNVLSYVDENPVPNSTNYYVVRAMSGGAEGALTTQAGIQIK